MRHDLLIAAAKKRAAGYSPPTANLVGHWDASLGVTAADGLVSSWADQSGNGHALLQSTGTPTLQPTYLPAGVIHTGTAQSGSTSVTIKLSASALAINDLYNNMTVTITGGTGSGQTRTITDYVGSTQVATVASWAQTPDNTSTYSVSASQSSIFFDGVNDYVKASFTFSQPETIYIAFRQISYQYNDYIFDGGGAGNNMAAVQLGTSPQLLLYAGNVTSLVGGCTVGELKIFTSVFNGANSIMRVNLGTETVSNAGTQAAGGLTLANYGSTGFASNIQVYELFAYNTAHGNTDRDGMANYLVNKWGAT